MFELPSIYPITDAELISISISEQVKAMAEGGASLIQIRAKNIGSGKFLEEAKLALSIAHDLGARLIINDRVDIAAASGADGVHLGQQDLGPVHARKLLGENAIIGFSTHSISQATTAMGLPIDYIAVGPVFPTQTKLDHDPIVGLDGVRAVRQAIGRFPLVAIGGITAANARSVIEAGADSVAVIGAVHRADRPIRENVRHLLEILAC